MELSMRDRDGKVGQRPQYICKSTLFGTALLISFGDPSSYEVSLPSWNCTVIATRSRRAKSQSTLMLCHRNIELALHILR